MRRNGSYSLGDLLSPSSGPTAKMAEIVAKRLVEHLDRADLVIMKNRRTGGVRLQQVGPNRGLKSTYARAARQSHRVQRPNRLRALSTRALQDLSY